MKTYHFQKPIFTQVFIRLKNTQNIETFSDADILNNNYQITKEINMQADSFTSQKHAYIIFTPLNPNFI